MAIVAHTPYSGKLDCRKINDYVSDGHGLPASRVNRYLTNGHGQSQLIGAYNCPSDPVLATEFMKTLRLYYEQQHPAGPNRTTHAVTHQQIYVSPRGRLYKRVPLRHTALTKSVHCSQCFRGSFCPQGRF